MSKFRERQKTFKTGFAVSADTKKALHQMCIPEWLQSFLHCPLFSHPKLVGYTGETINQIRLVPDSLIHLVLTTLPMVFSWAIFFCQDATDNCTLAGSADSHIFTCRDLSTPPLLGRTRGMGSVGFRWSYAGNFAAPTTPNVHLARLHASVKKAGLDVHYIYLSSNAEQPAPT